MTSGFPSPDEIRGFVIPTLEEFLRVQGHDVHIIREEGSTDADGYSTTTDVLSVTVRGYMYPLDAEQRSATAIQGSTLPVPSWQLITPYSANLGEPGFRVEYATDPTRPAVRDRFYPLGLARDEGNYHLVWIVDLGSPGQRG